MKWWLLAIPQYFIVGVFSGSVLWSAWQYGDQQHSWAGLGLIGILAVIAAVLLLVTGRYPQQIFDFLLGLNRWVLRVAGYAGLMTDKYALAAMVLGSVTRFAADHASCPVVVVHGETAAVHRLVGVGVGDGALAFALEKVPASSGTPCCTTPWRDRDRSVVVSGGCPEVR